MSLLSILFTTIGLCLFEMVSSIDNAIVNASVLNKMSNRGRKLFLIWGVIFAVVIMRGILPWLILYFVQPQAGLLGALIGSFSGDKHTMQAIQQAAPKLLLAGGIFLLFLFLNWLFLEDKNNAFSLESVIRRQGVWFFAVVSILLSIIVWFALHSDPWLAFSAIIGSTGYFIVHGFREQAEKVESGMQQKNSTGDISKLLYLIIIDATFSMDGVLGAFAFTLSVPLILIGNGVGAAIIAWLTLKSIHRIAQYHYLKNGAMYAIGILGSIMILEGFNYTFPDWLSPLLTICVVGFFLFLSISAQKKQI